MEPKIAIIGRTELDFASIHQFLVDRKLEWSRDRRASPQEELVEFGGRICYLSFGERQSSRSNAEYIRNLIDQGHESVLEHASWTFIVSGVTRAFTHQLVRHRVGFSFSQLSQQYVDHQKPAIVEPLQLEDHTEASDRWSQAIAAVKLAYKALMELAESEAEAATPSRKERSRYIRSVARTILPNATETALVFTANARSLRHFLRIRGSIEGDPEMRAVSARVLSLLLDEAPALFCDFSVEKLPDGSPIIGHRDVEGLF